MAGQQRATRWEAVRRADEPAGAGLVLWTSAVLFVVVFYLTGIADLASEPGGFAYLGADADVVGFLFIATCVYAAIVLGSWAATRSFELPRSLRAAAERSGGLTAEVVLLACALLAAVVVVVTRSLMYAPLVAAVAAPAVATFFRTTALRPVAGLPAVAQPRGAHAALEDALPDFDPSRRLPEGYQVMHLDWRFDQTLSLRPRFEEHLVYSVQTLREMSAPEQLPGRTGITLFRHLVVAGVTREIVEVATILRRISDERGFGVLDEITHCVGLITSLVPTVTTPAPEAAAAGDGGIAAGAQYPLSTLVGQPDVMDGDRTRERLGTLDSLYVLMAAVLITLGHRVIVVEFEDHYSLGVAGATGMPGHYVEHDNAAFYFAGWVVGDGWRVGELPPGLADAVSGTLDVIPATTS